MVYLPFAEKTLKGVMAELHDCAFPLLDSVVCATDQLLDSKMLIMLSWLAPSPEDQVWRGQTYLKIMDKSSLELAKPLPTTHHETAKQYWLETLLILIALSCNTTPKESQKRTSVL